MLQSRVSQLTVPNLHKVSDWAERLRIRFLSLGVRGVAIHQLALNMQESLLGQAMAKEPKNAIVSGAQKPQSTHNQRSEPRFPLLIQIEVSGIDSKGQPFCENTLTSDVSERGCRFRLPMELKRDSIVAIWVVRTLSGRPADSKEVMFQIMFTRQEQGAWTTGAWTLQPDVTWCPDIPREAERERRGSHSSAPTSNGRGD